MLALVCGGAVITAVWFDLEINRTKVGSLLRLSGEARVEPGPEGLEWLDVETPAFTSLDGESLRSLVKYLKSHSGSLFLLGDSSIVYPLSGRCSFGPVVWFHPQLTVPWAGATATEAFQSGLLERFRAHELRYFVLENGGTQMGVNLETLPLVRDWLADHTEDRILFGAFELFRVRPRGP